MTFTRPLLQDLQDRAAADLASRLGLSSLLPKSVLRAIAYTLAGSAHELHGHLAYLALQQFPQTAEDEGLLRWADLRQITRKSATQAAGSATFIGVVASAVPIDTQVSRIDGARFKTTAAAVIGAGGNVSIPVQALVAGELGNCALGTELRLTSSVTGISSTAIVDVAVAGGADEELLEDLRQRILDRWRTPPRGGAAGDYVAWALEVAGVTRAWCYPNRMGPGTVGLTFAVDQAPYGPIPLDADLDLVRAHVDLTRPVTAAVFVFAPTPLVVNFQISGLVPNTPEVQDEIVNSLRDFFLREAEPEGTLLRSHMEEAISLASGEEDHVLDLPAADVVAPVGRFPILGTVAFV